MIIRKATPEDAIAIARVRVDTWRNAFKGLIPGKYLQGLSYEEDQKMFKEQIENLKSSEFVFVAEEEPGNVVGFLFGGPERTDNSVYKGEIYAIYVLKDHQNKGIGGKLVYASVKELSKHNIYSMLIWTIKDSPYRAFYESLGGKIVDKKFSEHPGIKLDLVAYGWSDTRRLDGHI